MITLPRIHHENYKMYLNGERKDINCFISMESYCRIIGDIAPLRLITIPDPLCVMSHAGDVYIYPHPKLDNNELHFTTHDNIDKIIHDREFHSKLMEELE
jgi:hypothetical protein